MLALGHMMPTLRFVLGKELVSTILSLNQGRMIVLPLLQYDEIYYYLIRLNNTYSTMNIMGIIFFIALY